MTETSTAAPRVCRLYDRIVLEPGQPTLSAIHPGAIEITERGLAVCGLHPDDRLLDIGCGSGASLAALRGRCRGYGLDPSPSMLASARSGQIQVFQAAGQVIPIGPEKFQAVLAECVFSMLPDWPACLAEIHRVLKPGGWLILSDLFARAEEYLQAVHRLPPSTGFQGLADKTGLVSEIQEQGFKLALWEDYSDALRRFACETDFFQPPAFPDQNMDPLDIFLTLAKTRPGYYLAVAQKC